MPAPQRRSARLQKKRTSNISKDPTPSPTTQPHPPQLKPKRTKPRKAPVQWFPKLYLRIDRKFLGLLPTATSPNQPYPAPLASPPLAPGTTPGTLTVLIAELPNLRPFAGGDTVDWLIKVAQLIFEPLGTGSLYTFSSGSLAWWMDQEMDSRLYEWRTVLDGEELRGTIYEFRPDDEEALLTLTRMSIRPVRSVTTKTSVPRAATFREALLRRDRGCVVTGHPMEDLLYATHLIPRRLGDHGVQYVMDHFVGSPDNVVDSYDPSIGVSLFIPLGILTDTYKIGYWNIGPDQYVIHNFADMPLNLNGGQLHPNEQALPLHGHQFTLTTPNPTTHPLPPEGVFNWHYTQCVLRKFSTPAYQALANIHYLSLPFRTREEEEEEGEVGESDVDFDDERNIANPPYPSYPWDLARSRARRHLEEEERERAIASWNSDVSASPSS
ncbi:hypothetical protein D9615_007294 [Tricholomella constricta]|uniref:Uncharacterized protein n=1 Tax=Tricholomella constricta TaxID=117010 RepID=A0A8H5H4S0_9AGAR|nr:hypothetical protein D9615_007294 [Tricholomella constricta]